MANRRLQYRQVFWRNGWSTASERVGQAPTGQRRAGRGTTTVTGSVLSELGAVTRVRLYPGPSPPRLSPLQRYPTAVEPRQPSGRPGLPPVRHARQRRPVHRRAGGLCRRCAGVRSVPPGAPASRSGAEDSRAAERQRPSGRSPRARERRLQARLAQQPTPSVPTVAACARRAFRGTRVVARRNALAGSSTTTPSGPTRPFRLARVPRPGMTNTDARDVMPGRRAGSPAGPWRFRPSPDPLPGLAAALRGLTCDFLSDH